MAYQPILLNIDLYNGGTNPLGVTLTNATVLAAGGGLPRRIEQTGLTGPEAVLADSPSNFWQFNEDTGATVIADSGSLAQAGVIETVTFGAAGQWPGTLAFTSAEARFGYIDNAIRPAVGDLWSIEVSSYGNPVAGSNGRIVFANYGTVTNAGITLFGDSVNTYFAFQDTPSTYDYFSWPTSSMPNTGWNLLTITCDGNHNYRVLINGVLITHTVIGATLGASISYGSPLCIGASTSGASPLPAGSILDWIAYFQGVQLTTPQVLAHYEGTASTGQARWTVPQATGIPTMLSIPGALGQTTLMHPVHAYLAVDGSPPNPLTDEVTPSTDLGVLSPTGDTVIDITLDDNTIYIGGAVGQGPTLWVEDGIVPGGTPNITAIDSVDGHIDITLSTLVGTIATPTSDPAPAVQVTGATNPSPSVLRLATDAAYPPPIPDDPPATPADVVIGLDLPPSVPFGGGAVWS